jgi:hypothetical protein
MIDVVIQNQNRKFVNCLQICMDSYTIKTKMKIANFLKAWESTWTHMHNYCCNSKSKL